MGNGHDEQSLPIRTEGRPEQGRAHGQSLIGQLKLPFATDNCGRQHVESNWMGEGKSLHSSVCRVFLDKYNMREGQRRTGNGGGLHQMETHVGPSQQRDRMEYIGCKMGG